jgi:hypothetical protein
MELEQQRRLPGGLARFAQERLGMAA